MIDLTTKKRWKHYALNVSTLHPKGIEPLSQEPESYVISITLRVLTVYYYSILYNIKKDMFPCLFIILQFDISEKIRHWESRLSFWKFVVTFFLTFWTAWTRLTLFVVFPFSVSWTFFKSFDRKWYTFCISVYFKNFNSNVLTYWKNIFWIFNTFVWNLWDVNKSIDSW